MATLVNDDGVLIGWRWMKTARGERLVRSQLVSTLAQLLVDLFFALCSVFPNRLMTRSQQWVLNLWGFTKHLARKVVTCSC